MHKYIQGILYLYFKKCRFLCACWRAGGLRRVLGRDMAPDCAMGSLSSMFMKGSCPNGVVGLRAVVECNKNNVNRSSSRSPIDNSNPCVYTCRKRNYWICTKQTCTCRHCIHLCVHTHTCAYMLKFITWPIGKVDTHILEFQAANFQGKAHLFAQPGTESI